MQGILRSLLIGTLLGSGVIVFLVHSETGEIPSILVHWPLVLTALLLINLVTVALYFTSRSLQQRFSWKEKINHRIFLEVSSGLVYTAVAASFFAFLLNRTTTPPGSDGGFWEIYWEAAVKLGILALVIMYLYSIVNFSLFSYNQYSKHQLQKYQAERTQLKLQFDALRSQLNPHFLFNALNTVSSLIYRNTELAATYIRRLVFTYRYILKTNSFRLIPLKEELDLVNAFYFMQQIKYEDLFEYRQELPDGVLNTWIPPLTLQMLMENALKHNVIGENKKLLLEISEEGGFLVVKNNLIPKNQLLKIGNNLVERPDAPTSHKIGLRNIRERYAYFTPKKINIVKNGYFEVKLPLIKQKTEHEALLQ